MPTKRRHRVPKKKLQSRSSRSRKTSTFKHKHIRCNHVKRDLITTFMEMLTMIKLYHWNTHSFAQHKATDEIHDRITENVDKFVEVLLGKDESRLNHLQEKIRAIRSKNTGDFKARLYEYRECMIRLTDCFDARRDTDLLNIRDEILGDLNQLLYLFTLQ